jgi:hypothetical protein
LFTWLVPKSILKAPDCALNEPAVTLVEKALACAETSIKALEATTATKLLFEFKVTPHVFN